MPSPNSEFVKPSFRFGFVGLFLATISIAYFFAGIAYLVKASQSGNVMDQAIFFGFTLLGPFVLIVGAIALHKVTQFFLARSVTHSLPEQNEEN